jgi:preprotein translocase subunit SecA
MNEQRKVIYQRRDQILTDADLREETLQNLAEVVEETIQTFCGGEFGEDWDLEGLQAEIATIWPSELTVDQLKECLGTDELYDLLMGEATGYYERREQELGEETMRQIERQVMLSLIDQHWREHLYEMDYLQEGIHLRAMGQKDPLVEWQREGFDMFGVMMSSIARNHLKYVMHVQVIVEDESAQPDVSSMRYTAPEDPSSAGGGMAAAAQLQAREEGVEPGAAPEPVEEVVQQPIVKSDWDKTPRNAPCPCGSGKKFKQCHGA